MEKGETEIMYIFKPPYKHWGGKTCYVRTAKLSTDSNKQMRHTELPQE